MIVLIEEENGFNVQAEIADTFLKRLLGLMFRPGLNEGNGLLLDSCSRIHTCFMRFPIDVVYLDHGNKVLKRETVYPWRLGSFVKGTRKILELNKGAARKLKTEKQLFISCVEERRS
ncbi:DUF192 domain-containing protein [Clostridium boliviensis]|uniref:DUF192 domain-containing protein n=1 Tax=Clostridium boliviensis TaxID=318465 RepID=A0ABU4GGC4_9CLOT|nr:DUF192 domain-containing protein [Clostridium boliviensis]MDW2796669.1 DUF192 domain-containing protein [Clostridium boliviensis]